MSGSLLLLFVRKLSMLVFYTRFILGLRYDKNIELCILYFLYTLDPNYNKLFAAVSWLAKWAKFKTQPDENQLKLTLKKTLI